MTVELSELRRLLREATPKDWKAVSRNAGSGDSYFLGWEIEGPPDAQRGQFARGADAALIVALRNSADSLLDYIEHVEADNRALRSQIGEVARQRDNARFVADKRHQLVEALGEQVRELRADLRRAKAERDALAMRDAAGAQRSQVLTIADRMDDDDLTQYAYMIRKALGVEVKEPWIVDE